MIEVVEPGLFTTIQDSGRWGYQHVGVPVAGPMDRSSHRLANLLVGNRASCATLEVTLLGPRIAFGRDVLFAVTGAEFDLDLNGAGLAMNTVHAARAGQQLAFGPRRCGARAYLALAGGIESPPVLGSRATHVGSALGGLDGRALRAGDRLALAADLERLARPGEARDGLVRVADGGARVRIIPGPHDDRFGPRGIAALQAGRYRVRAESDRMGYRLAGPPLEQQTAAGDLISSAVPTGALQVPPSGEPIVLMADRQTTGGYPRIATVISADVPVVAQLAPSDWIEFEACTLEVALRALIAQERRLMG